MLAATLSTPRAAPAAASGPTIRQAFTTEGVSADGWVHSAPEDTTPFVLLGVSLGEGVQVRVRTADGSGPWSSWTTPDVDDDLDDHAGHDEGEELSEPIWTGLATRIQIAVRGGDPEQVVAHLVPAEQGFMAANACTPDLGLPGGPTIVSRTTWGAAAPAEEIEYAELVTFGVIHHTAGTNDYAPGDGCAIIKAIQSYHMGSRGWADIGYNLLVDRYGTIYEGRAGGVDQNVIGAHARDHNTGSFGTAALGTFAEPADVTPELEDALATIVAWKFGVHGIDPAPDAVTTTATGKPTPTLVGHRDVGSTACPGEELYARIPTLRTSVSELAAADAIPPHVSLDGVPVVGDWDGDGLTTGGWFLDGTWYLVNELTTGAEVWTFKYGRVGDVPIVGDWDGDGDDTIGVVRGNEWQLRNTNNNGAPDVRFGFGADTDVPIVGNWDGVAGDEPGIRRGKTFRLRHELGPGRADVIFGFGLATDIPIAGDFNADGTDDVGVVRDNTWRLRFAHAGGVADVKFHFARPNEGDIPITGDWDGDEMTTVGIVRGESWRIKNVHEGGKADLVIDSLG